MMKVIGIGGEPATGKSSLMEALMNHLGQGRLYKSGLLVYHHFPEASAFVLGKYGDGQKFEGTDRLSMAVQPHAFGVLAAWGRDKSFRESTVLFEGDRLFNVSLMNALDPLPIRKHWFVTMAREEELKNRHAQRKDGQKENWLRGRRKKIQNILNERKDVKILRNDTKAELQKNADLLLQLMRS